MTDFDTVADFAKQDPANVKIVIGVLAKYLNATAVPDRLAAVRLALIGIGRDREGESLDFTWSEVVHAFNLLFPQPSYGFKGKVEGNRIKRFAFGMHKLTDAESRMLPGYLAATICHLLESDKSLTDDILISQATRMSDNTLQLASNYLRSGGALKLGAPQTTGDDGYADVHAIRRMMGATDVDDGRTRDWLFRGMRRKQVADDDEMYFAVYRYSTNNESQGQIVRSFLKVQGPAATPAGPFAFEHIYTDEWARYERFTRGAVCTTQNTIYLVGTSRACEGTAFDLDRIDGIKMMAIPASVVQDATLRLTGVYLSNSAKWRPIVGRFAMIRIGTKATLSQQIDESVAGGVRVLEDAVALKADIAAINDAFKPAQHIVVADKVAYLFDYVVKRINNSYEYDRARGLWSQDGHFRAIAIEEGGPPPQ
jgi:hypothetical protein